MILQLTSPYSPQSNGIAEKKNRTLTNMINSMLITSGLTKCWWGEALLTLRTILNMIPQNRKDLTSYKMWHKIKSNLKTLKVWDCLAKVGFPNNKKRKLGPKTVDGIFLGYANN